MFFPIVAALALAGTTYAHSTLQYVIINGAESTSCIRRPPSNSPIQNVQSTDMACNVGGGNPAASTCSIAAGSAITLEWHHEGRTSQAIDPSHKGPVMTYLAKVASASGERNPAALNWFKISEAGLANRNWAVDTLNANKGKWTITLPRTIAPGDYLLRSEVLALHSAYSVGGAQFYMGCVQITVTGGGNLNPPTVKIPGTYSATHPGIQVSIYDQSGSPYPASYSIPGPPVIVDNGGTASTTVRPTTTSRATTLSTSRVTTTARPTTTSGGGGGAALYGQCGGQGFTGPTTCAQGTCTYSNQYYSQCLP